MSLGKESPRNRGDLLYSLYMEDMTQVAQKLLSRHRVGLLMRVFALSAHDADRQVESVSRALEYALALTSDRGPIFSRIDLLVSSDDRYAESDKGGLAVRLKDLARRRFLDAPIVVSEVKRGDVYAMLLNYGIASQMEDRVSYSFIVSHRLSQYITQENIIRMLYVMHERARVCGLVIPETDTMIESGRVQNSFACWHNKSLVSVGGFDLVAASPRVSPVQPVHVSKHDEGNIKHVTTGTSSYPIAGTEEIIPLIRLIDTFGPCIAVVPHPTSHRNNLGTTVMSGKELQRHNDKMATKEYRQQTFAATLGVKLEYIQQGLMTFPHLRDLL